VVPNTVSPVTPELPSLAEESRELGTVQAALGAKDASRALQLLDAQDRRFHGGNLTQERSASRVIALCIAGRISEADLAKSRFVTAYPGSPWLRRIAVACNK
jgi:outer membrane protein assembly factor BamD (BamD/ComL family)